MAKKQKTFDDIPDLIEDLINVQQKEIDRLQTLPKLEPQDVKNTIAMMNGLNSIYLSYRVLKQEAKKQLQSYTPSQIQSLKDQLAKAKDN